MIKYNFVELQIRKNSKDKWKKLKTFKTFGIAKEYLEKEILPDYKNEYRIE